MSGKKVTTCKVQLSTISSSLSCSPSGALGDLAHAEFAVMAYSTQTPPPGHIMTKANAVSCTPLLEETQCSSEPLTWLEVVIYRLKLRSCCVLEIFSDCGKYKDITVCRLYHVLLFLYDALLLRRTSSGGNITEVGMHDLSTLTGASCGCV